jgi:hypothetical protein
LILLDFLYNLWYNRRFSAGEKMMMQRCDHCNQQFQPAKSWQRFCTPKCRDAWHYEQWKLAQADVGQVNGVNGHGAVSGTAIVEAIKSAVAPAEPFRRRQLI